MLPYHAGYGGKTMMNRKNRISFSRTKTMLAGIAAVAMLVSLPACVRRQENEPMPFAPQEETDMDTERIPYVINNEYVLDMGGMDALLQPEDYTFVPTESDLTILRSLEEQYPEYAERIQFFIDHIGAYHQTAVNNVCVAPEKIDFVLAERFATQTETGEWNFSLDGITLPYYIQYDHRWAFHPYGNGVMGYTGCGPTCFAMVSAAVTGNQDITPDRVADYALDRGFYVSGSGTDWRLFTEGAEELGFHGKMIYPDESVMKQELWNGNYLVVSMRHGDFTRVGHFVVIHSCDEDGFWLYDPNSIERSSRVWPYEMLLSQIAQVWTLGQNIESE